MIFLNRQARAQATKRRTLGCNQRTLGCAGNTRCACKRGLGDGFDWNDVLDNIQEAAKNVGVPLLTKVIQGNPSQQVVYTASTPQAPQVIATGLTNPQPVPEWMQYMQQTLGFSQSIPPWGYIVGGLGAAGLVVSILK